MTEAQTRKGKIDVSLSKLSWNIVSYKMGLDTSTLFAHAVEPKTLFFASNDISNRSHADDLVTICKELFNKGDDFVAKITGNPNVDRPLEKIRKFRNRPEPKIVVSVDMLSTGVDIPALEYIVFLRPVKSRILWEQMLGRGTRLCTEINKDRFTVFDCFDGTLIQYFKDVSNFTFDEVKSDIVPVEEVIIVCQRDGGQVGWIDDYLFNEELVLIGEDGAPFFDKSKSISFVISGKSWVNNHAHVLRANQATINKYLEHYLNNFDYNGYVSGTTRLKLNQSKLKEIKVLLPPLGEQQRIVKKLDSVFEKVNKSKARLERIPLLLKNMRQSILAAAVSGELTKEWRENNEDVESARQLFERLISYRQAYFNNGNSSRRVLKLNIEPFSIQQEEELPQSWMWTRLLNLSEVIGGVTKGRKLQGKQTIMLPYLRVANVQDGYLDLTEMKEIEVLPEDLEKYKLIEGDILFTEGGDRDKLGRGTLWRDEIENCIHQNHIFRARVFQDFILPEFISIFTKTKVAKDYFYENASQTVNLASINLTTLSNVPIALPPYEEQKEIVRKVEELFVFADTIEARYKKAKAYFDKIPQAILTKAFKGELVKQDENDEPASELLKRIKQQKQATTKPKTKQRAKRYKMHEGEDEVSMVAEGD